MNEKKWLVSALFLLLTTFIIVSNSKEIYAKTTKKESRNVACIPVMSSSKSTWTQKHGT